jgi:hypothetical protein
MAQKLFSRRNVVLGATGMLAVAAAFTSSGLKPLVPNGARRMLGMRPAGAVELASATHDLWAAQVGQTFTIAGQTLRLAGIRALPSPGARPASLRQRGFLAVFDVAGGATLPGDLIYELSHRLHGELSLFLTATDTPSRVHAVFN